MNANHADEQSDEEKQWLCKGQGISEEKCRQRIRTDHRKQGLDHIGEVFAEDDHLKWSWHANQRFECACPAFRR